MVLCGKGYERVVFRFSNRWSDHRQHIFANGPRGMAGNNFQRERQQSYIMFFVIYNNLYSSKIEHLTSSLRYVFNSLQVRKTSSECPQLCPDTKEHSPNVVVFTVHSTLSRMMSNVNCSSDTGCDTYHSRAHVNPMVWQRRVAVWSVKLSSHTVPCCGVVDYLTRGFYFRVTDGRAK